MGNMNLLVLISIDAVVDNAKERKDGDKGLTANENLYWVSGRRAYVSRT